MLLLKLIDRIPFFANFSTEHKQVLAESDTFFTHFDKGAFLIREGSIDPVLLIIVRGSAIVTKNDHPDQPLATLPAGAVVGEIAFLTNRVRTSNVVAAEKTTCFAIDRASLEEMELAIQLKFKDELIESLIKHLDTANQALAKARAG
ncbi:MAG: cyclic nucleotide-binding domain-containing protein [Magnetococcus sp. YQC-3]